MRKIYQKKNPDVKNPVKRDFGGFTLIELLVVVLIIGILAAVALPKYKIAVVKSRIAAFLPVVKNVYEQRQMFYMANGRYETGVEELESIPTGFRRPVTGTNAYLYGEGSYSRSIWFPPDSPTVIGLLEDANVGVNHKGFCMASPSSDFAQQVCRSYSGLSAPTSTGNGWNYYNPYQ